MYIELGKKKKRYKEQLFLVPAEKAKTHFRHLHKNNVSKYFVHLLEGKNRIKDRRAFSICLFSAPWLMLGWAKHFNDG